MVVPRISGEMLRRGMAGQMRCNYLGHFQEAMHNWSLALGRMCEDVREYRGRRG